MTINWKLINLSYISLKRNIVITNKVSSHQKLNKSLKILIPIRILMKNQKKRYLNFYQTYLRIKKIMLKKYLLYLKIIIILVMLF